MIDQARLLLDHQVCVFLAGRGPGASRAPCSGDFLSREGDLGVFFTVSSTQGATWFLRSRIPSSLLRPSDRAAAAAPSTEPFDHLPFVYGSTHPLPRWSPRSPAGGCGRSGSIYLSSLSSPPLSTCLLTPCWPVSGHLSCLPWCWAALVVKGKAYGVRGTGCESGLYCFLATRPWVLSQILEPQSPCL